MGFYIRKALKVGPLRFNLSKSGLGVSAGIKGLRLGTGPRGNYIHMGRGGLYFRKSLNAPQVGVIPSSHQSQVSIPSGPMTAGQFHEIESGSVLEMVDASSAELLQELNEKRKKIRLYPMAISITIVAVVLMIGNNAAPWLILPMTAALIGLCWIAQTKDALRKTTVIFYSLEADVEKAYQQFHAAFSQLGACAHSWHIKARADVLDRKYHAGASHLLNRTSIDLKRGEPPFVKSNVEIPIIPVGKQILAFMPDRLLVFDTTGVGAVNYEQLNCNIMETQFIEEEAVPRDTVVVGKTWRYVNKKGGPDRRFNNNRELPICLYGQIHFSSSTGLNEIIQVSRPDAGSSFAKSIESLAAMRNVNTNA